MHYLGQRSCWSYIYIAPQVQVSLKLSTSYCSHRLSKLYMFGTRWGILGHNLTPPLSWLINILLSYPMYIIRYIKLPRWSKGFLGIGCINNASLLKICLLFKSHIHWVMFYLTTPTCMLLELHPYCTYHMHTYTYCVINYQVYECEVYFMHSTLMLVYLVYIWVFYFF